MKWALIYRDNKDRKHRWDFEADNPEHFLALANTYLSNFDTSKRFEISKRLFLGIYRGNYQKRLIKKEKPE